MRRIHSYPFFTFYWRVDLDVKTYDDNEFYRCDSGAWSKKTVEGPYASNGAYCSGYEWKVKDKNSSREVRIKPLDAGDDASGRRAVAYVFNYNVNEFDGGSPGGLDDTPDLDDFDSPAESITTNGDIVVWYRVTTATYSLNCNQEPPANGADCKSGFVSRVFNYP